MQLNIKIVHRDLSSYALDDPYDHIMKGPRATIPAIALPSTAREGLRIRISGRAIPTTKPSGSAISVVVRSQNHFMSDIEPGNEKQFDMYVRVYASST